MLRRKRELVNSQSKDAAGDWGSGDVLVNARSNLGASISNQSTKALSIPYAGHIDRVSSECPGPQRYGVISELDLMLPRR